MNTEHAQQELVDEFSMFDNWMDRYQYLIDMGKLLPEFPEHLKTSETRIEGCQSNVWIHDRLEDGVLYFDAASDAAIVSGLIAVLMRIYNGRTPQEISATSPAFMEELGLDKHLSPTRSNGLHAMLNHIYHTAKNAG
ncbi:SufE family protein [Larsenimonas rhizosphaerae]|uniref:SufE family protein n=1 Tax=Larsenimonas rhizosphaerae TaxID=2944682 RepID=A0AA41ZF49_9GAMM|nr:SufE family protein [Larsenimonas rhizosphaerae]MCM2130701.1 SufE family protein [Larsenimonas rhizosphaerae]MCX2523405.1 SufE family protein [Larsenimonas rhizosphaerae]